MGRRRTARVAIAAVAAVLLAASAAGPTAAREEHAADQEGHAADREGHAATGTAPGTDLGRSVAAQSEPAPTVTVEPDRLLEPGETATVRLAGLSPHAFVVLGQCPVDDPMRCGPQVYAEADGDGAGAAEFVVRRWIYGDEVLTDCAVEDCEIAARTSAGLSAPIAIDPDAPIDHPEVGIDTTAPLADLDVVTMSGSGFTPGTFLHMLQCDLFACIEHPLGYATAGPDGTFSGVEVVVRRELGKVDCAKMAGRCQIWVGAPDHLDQLALVWLTFDAESPPAATPSLSVEPSAGLLDGQTVTVTGTGMRPNRFATIAQCRRDGTGGCSGYHGAVADSDGTVEITVPVSRRLAGTDCAEDGCAVVLEHSPYPPVAAEIGFDTSVPPPPEPALTVEPSADLEDLETVSIVVEHLSNDAFISARLCSGASASAVCELIVDWQSALPLMDGEGRLVVEAALPRLLGGTVDCAESADCTLRVEIEDRGEFTQVVTPITFDPDSPLGPSPSLRALPSSALWDGQRIELRAEHLRSSAEVTVRQCSVDTVDGTRCGRATWVPSGSVSGGELSTVMTAQRSLSTPSGAVDCVAVQCYAVLQVGSASVAAPLSFDPEGTIGFPAQLSCVAWPTDGWPIGPLPNGVDRAALDAMVDSIDPETGNNRSIVVIHGGRLVYEWYEPGSDADTIRQSYSVSKSFTSTVAGLLVGDGVLDLDAPAPVPEWSDPEDPRHAITLRHLLHMNPGLEWDESYSFQDGSDIIKMLQSGDAGGYVADKPLVAAPGTAHNYSTGTTTLIGRIIAQETDSYGEDYQALLDEILFDPLGIQPVNLGMDASGVWIAGGVTNTTTRNFAKLGHLYLRGGVWEDEPFLPEGWTEFVRTPSPTSSGYGAQFWLDGDGRFRMVGLNGQAVHIAPDLDLVVAVTNGAASTGQILSLFDDAAAPTCGDPLVADDTAEVTGEGTAVLDVLANDPGAGEAMEPVTLTVAELPDHGTATVDDGRIRYTPAEGFAGIDTFTYVACTVSRRCAEATVGVTIGDP